jgi:hypothetical protein
MFLSFLLSPFLEHFVRKKELHHIQFNLATIYLLSKGEKTSLFFFLLNFLLSSDDS